MLRLLMKPKKKKHTGITAKDEVILQSFLNSIFLKQKKPNLRDLAFQMSNSRSPQLESDLFFTLSNQAFK